MTDPAERVVEVTEPAREAGRLEPCPWCAKPLTRGGGCNPYGRCNTKGCWMHARALTVALDDPRQVAAWNTRVAHAPQASEGYKQKLRMIVSHATGGSSQDIDASVNDICVRISANRNVVYARGKEVGLEDAAKAAEHHRLHNDDSTLTVDAAIRALKESAK